MMIHPTDASIANPTMMRERRLEGLTLTTHAQFGMHPPLHIRRDRSFRHRPRIRQGRLDVTGQRQRGQPAVNQGPVDRNPARLREKGDRPGTVANQDPDEKAHDGAGGVVAVEPNAVLIGSSELARPGQVVVRVFVVG